MKHATGHTILIILFSTMLSACSEKAENVQTPIPKPAATNQAATPAPSATTTAIKNGDYPGKGVVAKINMELGSVEMNHEEIKGVMPAMLMEFYVSDKGLLRGLAVGDKIDFVLRYKDHTETIVDIKKSK